MLGVLAWGELSLQSGKHGIWISLAYPIYQDMGLKLCIKELSYSKHGKALQMVMP